MKKESLQLFLAITILCLYGGIAHGMSSANYRMRIDVLSGGGGPQGSVNYDLDSALGQSSAIGPSSSIHYINHAGFWSIIPGPEPYIPVYVAQTGNCGNKTPCYNVPPHPLQTAITSSQSFSVLNVTSETYIENIVFSSPKFFTLRGGWDSAFTDWSAFTVIQGSITISNGKMIVEYITLK